METKVIKTLTYRNGDPIRTDFEQSGKEKEGAVKVVNDNYYYNWFAVNDPRGLEPEGYEVPVIEKLMELDIKLFEINGYVDYTGSLVFVGLYGYWWSSDSYDGYRSWYIIMECSEKKSCQFAFKKSNGFNVICVKKQLKNNKIDEILREEELKAYSNYHQVVGDNIETEKNRYYGSGDTEAIKVIEDWGLGFSLGNAVKYIARAGKKTPDKIKDLKKALWYIEREIKNEMDLFNKTIG